MNRRTFFASVVTVVAALQLPPTLVLRRITVEHNDASADRRPYDVFEVPGSDVPDVIAWETSTKRAEPLSPPQPFHRANGQRYIGTVYVNAGEAATTRLHPRSFVRAEPWIWHYNPR